MVAKNNPIKKREIIQSVLFPALVMVFTFGLVFFLIFSNLRINQRIEDRQDKIESLKKEIQILEEKKAKLEAGLGQTESSSYWEEKARDQGYQKPGESAVVVLPPEENQQSSVEKPKSFWEKIKEKLGF